jgi:tryptophanyl-tRNA synthetase
MKYSTDIFTGIRTSGNLTIGNVIGAVKPILEVLEEEKPEQKPLVFAADLHALTDGEPADTQTKVIDTIRSYMALGLDDTKADIFIQSSIVKEVSEMNTYLSRLVRISELMRIPTLKEKLKVRQKATSANLLLVMYPVMMASDILLQKSARVPVGEDQIAHLEITRELAKRFNKQYGEVLPLPDVLSIGKPARVKSLNGSGKKMSKTDPNGAILLDDDIADSLRKVKKAQTAFAGETSDSLDALVEIGKFVANTPEKSKIIGNLIVSHFAGDNVMGEFKKTLSQYLEEFLTDYQAKKQSFSDDYILEFIERGNKIAKENAESTLKDMREAMGMKYIN